MTPRALSAAAAAATSLMSLTLMASPTWAQTSPKEKCFGIVKAGQNNCASLSGAHSCAGQAQVSLSPDEWKYVPAGTCKQLKGLSMDEAKAELLKNAGPAQKAGSL
jgi:uncharacterized membrane protein